MKLLNKALRILYPRACPVCGDIIKDGAPYICSLCAPLIDYMNCPRCLKCSRPLEDSGEELCEICRSKKRFFDTGYALMRHDERTKNIVYDLKYRSLKDNAEFIGYQAAGLLGKEILSWRAEAVIPVPLHKKREHERGFNQAQLIAEKFLEFLPENNMKLDTECLKRPEATRRLKDLKPEEREKNISGAFSLEDMPYKRVLLVDDILTTGTTLNECARVLKAAGAERVFFLTASVVSGGST